MEFMVTKYLKFGPYIIISSSGPKVDSVCIQSQIGKTHWLCHKSHTE